MVAKVMLAKVMLNPTNTKSVIFADVEINEGYVHPCRRVYAPEQNLDVDEPIVLFKGRLKFRQYKKTKRARIGIWLYELTTFEGITLDFLVYCGKGMYYDDNFDELLQSERIPVALIE